MLSLDPLSGGLRCCGRFSTGSAAGRVRSGRVGCAIRLLAGGEMPFFRLNSPCLESASLLKSIDAEDLQAPGGTQASAQATLLKLTFMVVLPRSPWGFSLYGGLEMSGRFPPSRLVRTLASARAAKQRHGTNWIGHAAILPSTRHPGKPKPQQRDPGLRRG